MSVLGLDGKHTWNDEITLNDVAEGVYPRYRVRRIPGLHTRRETEDNRDQAVGRSLEIPRKSLGRGKALVYEGLIEARTREDLADARTAMLSAFASNETGRMVIAPRITGDATPVIFYEARVTALDIPEEYPSSQNRATLGYERPFTLGLRMHDARFLREQSVTYETGDLASVTGTSLPWSFPVTIGAPDAASGSVESVNGGSAPADPVFDANGPVVNPLIINSTIERQLRLVGLSIAAGEFVRIDFSTRQILLNGTEDVRSKLDRYVTDWWDDDVPGLVPGPNQILYRGDSIVDPASLVITFHEAEIG